MSEIPISLILIYRKLRERSRGIIIKTDALKEIITRTIICKDGLGGIKRGIPKIFLPEVVKDLINFSLIKRIDHTKYEILESNCLKRLKNFFPY